MGGLKEIVFEAKRETYCVEETMIGGIIIPLIKIYSYDVYIYGGGKDISSIISYCWACGIEIKGILDNDRKKSGKLILDKVPVIFPDELHACDSSKTFALINTIYFAGLEQQRIMGKLYNAGITKFYALNDYDKWQMKAQSYEWTDSERIDFYREHIDELECSYEALYDNASKQIMLEYIRAYCQFGVYSLPECDGNVKYFYGKKTDDKYEELYSHLDDEVWINCGSSLGDNIFQYFANGLDAHMVYAFEADAKTYKMLCANLEYLPEKYRNKVTAINNFINNKTDFGAILGDHRKITLINADIEGNELELLKNMNIIIKQDRPVLAICAYHKPSDLTELFKYINETVNDYIFVLRKYMASFGSSNRTAELVLYAIPKERSIVEK